MKILQRFLVLLCMLAVTSMAFGQLGGASKIKWSARMEPVDVRAGESAQIIVTADVDKGWHIYGLKQPEGPTSTEFTIGENPFVKANGDATQPQPKIAFDKGFKKDIGTHAGATSFGIPISISPDAKGHVKVVVTAMAQPCDEATCQPPIPEDLTVEFDVEPGEARAERTAAITSVPKQPEGHVAVSGEKPSPESKSEDAAPVDDTVAKINKAEKAGLIPYFLLAFGFGLLALLTPCVWPMVPITVSFFSKKTADAGKKNIKDALAYCIGIVATFTLIGLVVTLVFGASGVQDIAANPWVNIAIAVVFVALALSLFGLFEVALPASWITKIQRGSQKSGILGPILMGLTFSLTTFTCTVPFVGTILVSATKGNLLYPVIGMIGFSLAFAIPFFFLALFPQYLARMPRSGSWLSAVKVYMGFLEIAAALKFLSSADLVWQWRILTFPVFLAIWTALFVLAAAYLLGLFPKPTAKIGLTRRAFGVVTLAISGYCIAAIFGAPIGPVSGFVPPNPYPGTVVANAKIKWLDSIDEAMKQADKENKPIFVNFTGYTCTNCRVMEQDFFPRPEIEKLLQGFVTVELYTDRNTPDNKANKKLLLELVGSAANPTYVILRPSEKKAVKVFQGLAQSADSFIEFLNKGKTEASKKAE